MKFFYALLTLTAAVGIIPGIAVSPAVAQSDWGISPWVADQTNLPTLIQEGYAVVSTTVFQKDAAEEAGEETAADAGEAVDEENEGGSQTPQIEAGLYEIVYLKKGGRLYRCLTRLTGPSHRCEYSTFAVIGDKIAKQILQNAYEVSQIFFMYNPDAEVSLADLLKNGFENPEEVQIEVLTRNKRKFQMSATHARGSKVFFVNATGVISEADK